MKVGRVVIVNYTKVRDQLCREGHASGIESGTSRLVIVVKRSGGSLGFFLDCRDQVQGRWSWGSDCEVFRFGG